MSQSPLASPNLDAFLADVKDLRARLEADLGEADLAHLYRLERWGRLCTVLGAATAWIAPNPVSALALSLGRSTRWLLMHHIGHRGYDRVPGVPARYTSKVFARGWRRYLDWPDCFLPAAWRYEHMLHHSYTSEDRDPDAFERNTEDLRALPRPMRYVRYALLALTWRMSYYAPKTLRTWYERTAQREEAGLRALPPGATQTRYLEMWRECFLPYVLVYFVLFPLLALPLGAWAALSAFCNSLLAELLSNLHTFLVIGPNHTGEDLVRFGSRPASRAEHMYRQVIASTNYRTGGDLNDWAHLWLNYQIEHHLWPDLPMLKYRQAQDSVRGLCARHGIPYVQEGLGTRLRKMMRVLMGDASIAKHAPEANAGARQDDTALVATDRRTACEASL